MSDNEYPREDGDFLVLGPELFTGLPGTPGEGVISWKGENFYRTHDGKPPVAPDAPVEHALVPEVPLKDYKAAEYVQVFIQGDWVSAVVSSVEKRLNLVYVDTQYGPKAIASTHNIRRAG